MSSFGEELKRERELREITLREISEATKISLRYLESLERNDFTHLPGGVFNKGFVRAYAQYIGVDPETMVNAYLLEEQGQRQGERGSEMFRPAPGSHAGEEPSQPERAEFSVVRVALVVLVIAGLAGGAALAWWWWTSSRDPEPAESRQPSPAAGTAATERHGSAREDRGTPGDPVERLLDPHLEHPDEVLSLAALSAAAEPAHGPPAEPERRPQSDPAATGPATPSPHAESPVLRVTLQRPTQGRLNCDNRRVEILDRAVAGTEMVFHCRRFLVIDADDGGAVLLQKGSSDATAIGADGVPVAGLHVEPPGASGGNSS